MLLMRKIKRIGLLIVEKCLKMAMVYFKTFGKWKKKNLRPKIVCVIRGVSAAAAATYSTLLEIRKVKGNNTCV